jgi:hypothetical protein
VPEGLPLGGSRWASGSLLVGDGGKCASPHAPAPACGWPACLAAHSHYGGPTGRDHPSVFISHSWDSVTHKRWVRELAERLVTSGVKVSLDQWDVGPGESLTKLMEEQIITCDYVLVICTPQYARRSKERRGGVG